MAKANTIQTNFTSGEISPKLLGRTDLERYRNGVEFMESFRPVVYGGARSDPALVYVAAAKNADKKCRLIKFEFSKNEANILEVGENYIRFFNQDRTQVMDGGSPYEIATVYSESELFDIEYVANADTIFFFHPNHPVQRLQRFENDYWVIGDAPFVVEPFQEQGHFPAAALTLSAATVGAGRTATAGATAFVEGDVGRYFSYKGGSALITGFTSGTVVTCTIEVAFESTSIASGLWNLEGSPQLVCKPSDNPSVGTEIDLDLSTATSFGERKTVSTASYDAGNQELDFTMAANHGWSIANTVRIEGCEPLEYNGIYELITAAGTLFEVGYHPDPGALTTAGTAQLVTASTTENGWRSEDVGKHVVINGGLVKISTFVDATKVKAIVKKELSSDAEAQAGSWSLNSTIWNATNGYPRCGAFFQQRLVCAGSTKFPNTIAFSRTAESLNFEIGTDDTDAFLYTLDVKEFNAILHLEESNKLLVAITSAQEFTLTGGVEKAITPTNVSQGAPTKYGANEVKPVEVGEDLCYITRNNKKLRAMRYTFERDSYAAEDLSKLSEHITGDGITDMAYQQEPESFLHMVRTDGVLVTLAIDQQEGVFGWSRHPTDGAFESVSEAPGSNGDDELWCSVKRTIGGSDVRYIEIYDELNPYNLHSSINSSAGPATVWGGLSHLEGKTVECIADGVAMGDDFVVSSGQITLPRNANQVYIGLPARGYIKTLQPEYQGEFGTIQGSHQSINDITLRVLETVSLKIGGQEKDLRKFGSELLDKAPPTYTGDIAISKLGWKNKIFVELQQANALPVHILAMITELTANN